MKSQIIQKLKSMTKSEHILLADSGDKAIMLAMQAAKAINPKEKFLIPDQGGWFSYQKYPKRLNFNVVEIKTDYGVIDINSLKQNIDGSSAFVYSNPAGYFAEQPCPQIYFACKDTCLVIKDISGSIGNEKISSIADADFLVCSFGEWKPVNLDYGGFIAAKTDRLFKEIDASQAVFRGEYISELANLLDNLKPRLDRMYNRAMKVKEDLKRFNIIHPDSRGINVVVKFSGDIEKAEIISYCNQNKLEFTLCPRYIRVNEKAISIEIKRID